VQSANQFSEQPSNQSSHQVDGIIVLTGGSSRIAAGLDLLAQGRAHKLLISGVKPGVSLQTVINASGYKGKVMIDKISLDTQAKSTVGNAQGAANWIQKNNIHSFLIVTANYHMRRSLLEFRQRFDKKVKIVPYSVNPLGPVVCDSWCKDYKIFCLYLKEYNKYLGALARFAIREVYLALGI